MAKRTVNGENGSKLSGMARLCALAFLLCGCAAAASAAAGANLEEKMKYERALEQKVEEVLVNLLGPGKSRVMIRALLDFSSREKVELESGKPAEPLFKWQNINKPAVARELLPGYVAESQEAQPSGGKYQREVVFPQAMVKRLTVSLVLSEDISGADAQKVRRVVSELLALDPARGDDIIMMRTRFTPIWYTSEMLGTLVKYGIIAFIAIAGMGIVSIGFLRMASAMRSMAGPEPTKIHMEMGVSGEGEREPLGLAEPAEPGAAEKAGYSAPPEVEARDGVTFNIRADKLEILVRMLAKDEPADISLIAVHLPPGLRSRFISMLPPETASEVLANIVNVRFVEPELIAKIKDELERRLNGAVGGYAKAIEMIEEANIKSQKALIEALQKTHPDIAARVRSRILLLDDIERFAEKDFALLAGAVSVNLWTTAVWRISGEGRAMLKNCLSERAWQMLEQSMAYGSPADEKIDAAVGEVIAAARNLIAEGRIKKPGPEPAGLDKLALSTGAPPAKVQGPADANGAGSAAAGANAPTPEEIIRDRLRQP